MKLGFNLMAGLLALSLGACKDNNPNATKLQFMPDMADAPTVKAQKSFLNPPDHAVPVDGIIYPDDWDVAEKEFRSPFQAGVGDLAKVLSEGETHYNTFCAVCHGQDGKGQGTMGASYPIAVPDLTRAELAARGDGFFFMKISQGGAMMPSYGHAISPLERWQIVSYLRKLQKQEQ